MYSLAYHPLIHVTKLKQKGHSVYHDLQDLMWCDTYCISNLLSCPVLSLPYFDPAGPTYIMFFLPHSLTIVHKLLSQAGMLLTFSKV